MIFSFSLSTTFAFDYVLLPSHTSYNIRLVDAVTNSSDIPTLFRKENATVIVDGLLWQSDPLLLSTRNNNNDDDTTITIAIDNNATATTQTLAPADADAADADAAPPHYLLYKTYLNEQMIAMGSHDLSAAGTVPPSSTTAGTIEVDTSGRQNLTVTLQVVYHHNASNSNSNSNNSQQWQGHDYSPVITVQRYYQTYMAWVTIFPIFVMILFVALTGNTEISFSTTNLVSVCIAHGSFFRGTQHLIFGSVLGALTDTYNGVIMLLVFFLSGIMSLVDKTGGSVGFLNLVDRYGGTTKTHLVQFLVCCCGVFYFWDDVLSTLVLGCLFRPLLDMAHTSRPLTAMILDATAGPVASIVLASTWLVWEIPLLQQELSRLEDLDLALVSMTPFEVLQKSVVYNFYPIFMLVLMPLLVFSQRHLGQILMYERTTQVYQHTNGGPRDISGPCAPRLETPSHIPHRFWNVLLPLTLVSILFLLFLYQTGTTGLNNAFPNDSEPVAYRDWLVQNYGFSNVSLAWLQAVATGTTLFVISLLLQLRQGEDKVFFLPLNIRKLMSQSNAEKHAHYQSHQQAVDEKAQEVEEEEDGDELGSVSQTADLKSNDTTRTNTSNSNEIEHEQKIQPLIPAMELIASFFFGFAHVMPYMIQFILAWALRDSFTTMGLTRWIAKSLGDQLEFLNVTLIPAASFLTAFLMSLFTGGAARGRVASVLLPMVMAPVYKLTYMNDPDMIFQVIGAIMSGCVAGDHAAPLSNTSLLSSLSSDCQHLVHVMTQMPYIFVVAFLSLFVGTVPVGLGFYPIGAGYFLGVAFLLFFVFFLCFPVLDPSGQWDLVTRFYIRWKRPKESTDETISNDFFWDVLQRDTMRATAALAQGLPYTIEDCRPLMIPIDTGSMPDVQSPQAKTETFSVSLNVAGSSAEGEIEIQPS